MMQQTWHEMAAVLRHLQRFAAGNGSATRSVVVTVGRCSAAVGTVTQQSVVQLQARRGIHLGHGGVHGGRGGGGVVMVRDGGGVMVVVVVGIGQMRVGHEDVGHASDQVIVAQGGRGAGVERGRGVLESGRPAGRLTSGVHL